MPYIAWLFPVTAQPSCLHLKVNRHISQSSTSVFLTAHQFIHPKRPCRIVDSTVFPLFFYVSRVCFTTRTASATHLLVCICTSPQDKQKCTHDAHTVHSSHTHDSAHSSHSRRCAQHTNSRHCAQLSIHVVHDTVHSTHTHKTVHSTHTHDAVHSTQTHDTVHSTHTMLCTAHI